MIFSYRKKKKMYKYCQMFKVELSNVKLSFLLNHYGAPSLRSTILKSFKNKPFTPPPTHSDNSTLNALNNINIKIEKGRRVGVIGANGAGKTSLLKVISGIYEPTEGSVSVSGRISSFLSLGLGSHHECTGIESIKSQLLLLGYDQKSVEKLLPSIIKFSELEKFIHQPIKQYSSGMQMRLNFSILAQTNPEIVVMDEWLSTGDLYFVEKAQKRVQEMVDQAHILVLGSHDLKLLENVCTDIVFLENGKIYFHGDPKETIHVYRERIKEQGASRA